MVSNFRLRDNGWLSPPSNIVEGLLFGMQQLGRA
jgi:hypothetical protein